MLEICIECPRVERVQRDILQTMSKKCLSAFHADVICAERANAGVGGALIWWSTRAKGNRPHYAESTKGEQRHAEGVRLGCDTEQECFETRRLRIVIFVGPSRENRGVT